MSTSSSAITVEGLSVRYGSKRALDQVSLEVEPGSVYALLGRNGAGKSSLVRCLLGLQKPHSGRLRLFGEDVWTRRKPLMERVAVLSEESDAPDSMSVGELGKFSSRIYRSWLPSSFDARLARFEISRRAQYGELSKGQRRQVSLALALAQGSELLVLDDPTLGLDVVARKSLFEEVIAEMADRGITVFITTHDLEAIEGVADRVGILRDGLLVLDEELDQLRSRFRRIRFAERRADLSRSVLVPRVTAWGDGTEAVISNFNDDTPLSHLPGGADATEIVPMSLEEIFIAVAGDEPKESS